MFGLIGRTVSDFQKGARSIFELTQDSMAASVAVQMSNRARATVLDQWEKLTNVATERVSIERFLLEFASRWYRLLATSCDFTRAGSCVL